MKEKTFVKQVIEYLDGHKDRIGFIQFKSCNAYIGEEVVIQVNEDIFEDDYIRVVPIRSYNTIVGFADIDNKVVYEYGKYTPTTSKQFTQIYNRRFAPCGYDRVLIEDVDTSGRFVKRAW